MAWRHQTTSAKVGIKREYPGVGTYSLERWKLMVVDESVPNLSECETTSILALEELSDERLMFPP